MRRIVSLATAFVTLAIYGAAQTPDRAKLAEGSYQRKAPIIKGRPVGSDAVADRWTLWRTPDGYELESHIAPNDVRPPDELRSRTRFDNTFQVIEYSLITKGRGEDHELICKAVGETMTCTLDGRSASTKVAPPYVLVLKDEAALAMDFAWLMQAVAITKKKRPGSQLRSVVIGEDTSDPRKPMLRVEEENVHGRYRGEKDFTWDGKKLKASKIEIGQDTVAYLAPSGILIALTSKDGLFRFVLTDYKEEEEFLLRR
jgi:hypothetical protein